MKKVEKLDERTVRFTFGGGTNRELPLILGQLVVLPKHYWAERDFTRTTLKPPLGSGSYKIGAFEPGRHVEYQRVEDYWGRDLPVNVGRDNFDRIRHDYYRDGTVSVEAFKAGEYDFRDENSSKNWATAYDFPALRQGLVKKEEIPHDRSTGMQGFAFNSRRLLFQDRKVREALAYAFDFEWSNRTLFYGQYARTRSYFDNSELAATGLPAPDELAILSPHRGRLPEEVFTRPYEPPANDGSGRIRANLRQGSKLLREAGWSIDKTTRKLTHKATGRTMEFEILLVSPLFERIVLPFKKNLARLGITATVRTVDSAQYRRRLDDFDFDVVIGTWGQSLSPGNEQRNYWGSDFADRPGSRNLVGIKDPVVDALVAGVIKASDRKSLVNHVRALDRVLQWGHWVIPQWHIPYDRLVYWDRFGRPEVTPTQGVQFDTWWIDARKVEALEDEAQGRLMATTHPAPLPPGEGGRRPVRRIQRVAEAPPTPLPLGEGGRRPVRSVPNPTPLPLGEGGRRPARSVPNPTPLPLGEGGRRPGEGATITLPLPFPTLPDGPMALGHPHPNPLPEGEGVGGRLARRTD